MPSSKNYKRNYEQEMVTATKRGEDRDRAKRNAARRKAIKKGKVHKGDGKEIDHKKMLSKGGSNSSSNLRVISRSQNRKRNGHHTDE